MPLPHAVIALDDRHDSETVDERSEPAGALLGDRRSRTQRRTGPGCGVGPAIEAQAQERLHQLCWTGRGRSPRAIVLALGALLVAAPAGATGPDRMPPIPPDKMTDVQRKAAEELIKGPRGAVYGPFIPLLRSPELMSRLQKMGEYLRYQSAVGPRLSELAILVTARRWTQQVEWAIHQPIAAKNGVKPETIAAIAEGRRPAVLPEDEGIVYDFLEELFDHQSVSDATYGRAVARLGEQGVVDLASIAGYYTLLAMVMNVARTPVEGAKPPPLAPFPQ